MLCSICGESDERVNLFDMVGQAEIVKVCEDCARRENMPIIKRATEFQIKQSERRPSMKERWANNMLSQNKEVRETNAVLKRVVDTNYTRNVPKARTPRNDLVPNFHWGVMRARRYKRVTHEQMAKALGEPEAALKLAEQGILPEGDYRLARKIESYLGIKIIKSGIEAAKTPEEKAMEKLMGINPKFTSGLKIADLKRKNDESSWEDEVEVSTDFPDGLSDEEEK